MIDLPTIQELRSFILYGETHNFSLAAKKANITQSAFSAQIKKLESIVGVPLINRNTQGSSLTREGQYFLREAEKIVKSLELVTVNTRKFYKDYLPALHLGILRSFGDVLMNQYISHFQEKTAQFSLKVYDMEESEILLDLQADRIDMAVLYIVDKFIWQEYEVAPFVENEMVYYAPNLSQGKTLTKDQIWCQQFLLYPPKYMMNKVLLDYFQDIPDIKTHQEIQLSNPYAMVNYCQKYKAGCFLSKQLAEYMDILPVCNTLEIPLVLTGYFVYKNNNPKKDYIHKFIKYIAKH